MGFGENLGKAAYETAKKMGNTKSLGKCALGVGDALSSVVGEKIASQYRGNAYEWLSKAYNSPYWEFKKQTSDTTGLPAGALVIWNKQPAHPYGHVEIADGNGHLCSDFIRSDKLALYKSNPQNIIPHIFYPKEVEVQKSELPYKVRVTAQSGLNIRKLATLSSKILETAPKGTILTVWGICHQQTQEGVERIWGKNEKGFFVLEYTERI